MDTMLFWIHFIQESLAPKQLVEDAKVCTTKHMNDNAFEATEIVDNISPVTIENEVYMN